MALPALDPNGAPPSAIMLQMLGGFQISQALYVAAKLGVADALVAGPRPIAALAAELGAHPDALGRILRDLTGLGVFAQAEPGVFGLGPLGHTLGSGPGSVRDMALMWMETHYAAFGHLLHTARTGEPAAEKYYGEPVFDWLARSPDMVHLFSRAMGNLTHAMRAPAIASFDPGPVGVLADMGGATGTVLAHFLGKSPATRGILFDLPHVVQDAEQSGALAEFRGRVAFAGGSFFETAPAADGYILSSILHDWNDGDSARILQTIRRHANPGARIFLVEMVMPDGNQMHPAKMIDLTMLGMLKGRERTEAEWRGLAQQGGWQIARIHATPAPVCVIELNIA